jgi:hypothetical protein
MIVFRTDKILFSLILISGFLVDNWKTLLLTRSYESLWNSRNRVGRVGVFSTSLLLGLYVRANTPGLLRYA